MHPNQEQNLRLVGRCQYDGESVTRIVPRVSAWRGTGFGEGIGVRQRAINFSASSLPRGLRHSVEQQAHARLIATPAQFQISTSHIQRRNQPLISEARFFKTIVVAETGERRSRSSRIRQLQAKVCCCRKDLSGSNIPREHTEVGIAGVGDSGSQIDVAVAARTPAPSRRPATDVRRIFVIMQLTVGQRDERFQKRSERNRRLRAIPTRGEQRASVGIQQKKGNVVTGEIAIQRAAGGLSKQLSFRIPCPTLGATRVRTVRATAGRSHGEQARNRQERSYFHLDHS